MYMYNGGISIMNDWQVIDSGENFVFVFMFPCLLSMW